MSLSIRNAGLFGHGGSGKTTLAESILYTAGVLTRMGGVEQGNTAMDFDEDEINRTISINGAIGEVNWNNTELQIVDTPGYADFIGDALSASRVADTFLFVVSGVDGVEGQTEILWEKADESNSPRVIFISKLDREMAGSEADSESSNRSIADDAKTRLKAVILTTLITVAGVMPTAYGLTGYDAMLAEMMLALAWGLIFSTMITLVLVPCLYGLMHDWKFRLQSARGK